MWCFRLALIASLFPGLARAEPASDAPFDGEAACGLRSSWVLVESAELASAFQAAVLTQLRAGLRGEALDACLPGSAKPHAPSAVLEIRASARSEVAIEVRARQRTWSRRIELGRVPADGRALAVAVAADELIRAALANRPPVEATPERAPAAAARQPEASALREPTRTTAAGASFAAEKYGGGQHTLGLNLSIRHAFTERLRARLGLGARRMETVRTAHGEITGTLFGGELALGLTLLRTNPLSAGPELGVWAGRAGVEGSPSAGARGSERSGWFAVARGGIALEVRPTPWLGLELRAGGGATLRRLHLEDTGVTKTAIAGLELYGSFGPNVVF